MTGRNIFEMMEGPGLRRWYIVKGAAKPVVIAGPFPTRKRCRNEVYKIAKAAGDLRPWPALDLFEDSPGFCAMHTGRDVYYVGRASALADQGDAWGEAIRSYEGALAEPVVLPVRPGSKQALVLAQLDGSSNPEGPIGLDRHDLANRGLTLDDVSRAVTVLRRKGLARGGRWRETFVWWATEEGERIADLLDPSRNDVTPDVRP